MSDNIVKAAADRAALMNVLQSLLTELEARPPADTTRRPPPRARARTAAAAAVAGSPSPIRQACALSGPQDKGTYKCLLQFVQDADERERTMQETIERERAETARVRALKQQLKQEREEHDEARSGPREVVLCCNYSSPPPAACGARRASLTNHTRGAREPLRRWWRRRGRC